MGSTSERRNNCLGTRYTPDMTIWGTDPYEEPSECSRSREKLNEILDEERDVREKEEKMLKQEVERHEKRKAAEEEAKEERREQERERKRKNREKTEDMMRRPREKSQRLMRGCLVM
jgi:hypothetical protein